MTRIPVVTQNFSSPDVFSDSPLMLLPQSAASMGPLPDRDQEGFSQLLLHDLHRHRQSYVQSYTAFETLKKRQDFVLRQENLRSLQTLEQRVTTKQEQCLDQSFHSYEQCFVKVINGNSTPTRTQTEQTKSMKIVSPSFDKFHPHHLSHIPATPLDPPAIIPFHRYQKSHRPRVIPKYRSHPSIQRSAQCLHDAFQSTHSLNQSQPFLSFTESYLQKYSDSSFNRFPMANGNRQERDRADGHMHETMSEIRERTEIDDLRTDVKHGSTHQQTKHSNSQTRGHEPRIKSADYHRYHTNLSSRNTNTPSSTPQITYQDALQDGLTTNDEQHRRSKLSSVNEKQRRLSQQSSGRNSTSVSRSGAKRPTNSAVKKQQITVDLTSNKKLDGTTNALIDGGTDDILKQAMTVQNYGNTGTETSILSSILDRPSLSTTLKTTTTTTLKKTPLSTTSLLHRPQIRTTDSTPGSKVSFDTIDTQMTTIPLKLTEITEQKTNSDGTPIVPMTTATETTTTTNLSTVSKTDLIDPGKQLRKGPFDLNDSMKDLISFEFDIVHRQRGGMKKTRFNMNGQGKGHVGDETFPIKENQATLDLLEKVRQSVAGSNLGQYPISQRNCRFELPSDLKLLETMTPLDYLSKYCRLSPRRHFHYKRIFDKYRNNQYRFESNHLYTSIRDVHADSFTKTNYEHLCQLLDISNEQHQFAFDTFAGILALCERILCDSEKFRSGLDEHDLAKDTIEKCDFDSLDRKLDGLNVSETMKKLLRTL